MSTREAPATAVAANNFVRCLFGAGSTALVETVLSAMGRGWTYTFLALVVASFSPILYVITTMRSKMARGAPHQDTKGQGGEGEERAEKATR